MLFFKVLYHILILYRVTPCRLWELKHIPLHTARGKIFRYHICS